MRSVAFAAILSPVLACGCAVLLSTTVAAAAGVAAPEETVPGDIRLLPESVQLMGQRDRQQLIVEEVTGSSFTGDHTSGAEFVSDNPAVVAVSAKGELQPVADGTATVRASIGGKSAVSQVRVSGMAVATPISFRNDVQTILTKAGCNMGACHGAQAGKNGFKLALRGYDHDLDYRTLTRQARGRRVNTQSPAESLLLQKATGGIPHSGGIRFSNESNEYKLILDWIAAGAEGPTAHDPTVVSLQVLPTQTTLKSGAQQQLLVQATYTDGRVRDVTRWAKFTSTEIGVANISEEGRVTVVGNGEAAITVWFASRVTTAGVSVPYPNSVPADVFATSPQYNFIDTLVLEKLKSLQLPPSTQAGDATFVRRAYLDTLGVLPTPDEVKIFLADSSPDKRARLVESLFRRPEFVDYWTYKWSDMLLVSTRKLRGPAVWSFHQWIRAAVASNMPWNQFATEIVTASGSTLENGAANFYVLHKDPKVLSETTTVTFLGLSVNCAQCHDHPLERWTQDDYYGMANLFSRVRLKDGSAEGESVVFAVSEGDIKHPSRIGIPVPRPLDGEALSPSATDDRRVHLAKWLTERNNPYFARAIVNRVWANYMGRGLVEMVDDLRATNPASNEVLLSALADDFMAHGYDVRHLIRTIMNSAAYQRSAVPNEGNAADDRFYSRFIIKRMSAEVMLDALSQVTAIPSEFPEYPRGLRALQLPDNNVVSYFLSAFGRPAREFTCECERSEEPSVTQTLHLVNGGTLNSKLKSPGGTIDRWLDSKMTDEGIVAELYLTSLARYPTAEERDSILTLLADPALKSGDDAAQRAARRSVFEDLGWALLTTREFLFVH